MNPWAQLADPPDHSDKGSWGEEKLRECFRGPGGMRDGEGKGHDGTAGLLLPEAEEAKGSLAPSLRRGTGLRPPVRSSTAHGHRTAPEPLCSSLIPASARFSSGRLSVAPQSSLF